MDLETLSLDMNPTRPVSWREPMIPDPRATSDSFSRDAVNSLLKIYRKREKSSFSTKSETAVAGRTRRMSNTNIFTLRFLWTDWKIPKRRNPGVDMLFENGRTKTFVIV